MQCTVLLFAQLAEAVGARQLDCDVPDGATVGDALDELSAKHPPIAAWSNELAVAVDERYAGRDAVLTPGCTVALIPPVSGG